MYTEVVGKKKKIFYKGDDLLGIHSTNAPPPLIPSSFCNSYTKTKRSLSRI